MIEGGFRPKSLGLYRPKIHIITFTFFTFFYVFFENPKKWLFTFFALLHTFSQTMPKTLTAASLNINFNIRFHPLKKLKTALSNVHSQAFVLGGTTDPRMAVVSLSSRALGRKIHTKLTHFFVKNVFLGILGGAIPPPSVPILAMPTHQALVVPFLAVCAVW